MIAYNVNANKKKAIIVSGCLFAASITCFLFSALDIDYKVLLQIVGLVIAFFATQVAIRYIACDISYAIDDRGPVILKVHKIQSGRSKLIFGILFEYIYKIEKVSVKGKKEEIKPKVVLDYCGTLFPTEYYIIYFKEENREGIIKLEINEAFAREIELRINNFREADLKENY